MIYNPNIPILFVISDDNLACNNIFDKIRNAAPKRLYIAGALSESETEQFVQKSILAGIDWKVRLKTRLIKKCKDYDKMVFQAIDWFFKNEPEGIILESLIIPSDSFFGFCSSMLEKYRDDERIGHIAGKNYNTNHGGDSYSYYFSFLFNTGNWAGWRRAWKDIDLNFQTFPLFKKLNILEKTASYRPFKTQWENHFKWLYRNKKSGFWQLKYLYSQLINNRLSIVPSKNLTVNHYKTVYENNYKINELSFSEEEIIHPPFVIGDVVSDWKSQEIQFSVPGITVNRPDGYSYMKNQLALLSTPKGGRMKIPRIIHQIFEDPEGPSETLLQLAETWKQFHPDWEYRFWNKPAIDEFLVSKFPDFIPYYRNFSFNVQRWDAIRYLILYYYGGLYVDLDYECLQSLDLLLVGHTCCMGMEPTVNSVIHSQPLIIGNALMASTPGHNYFKSIIQEMKDYQGAYRDDADRVMKSTGPFMVTRVYEQYKKKREVTLLSADLVAPLTLEEIKLVQNKWAPDDIVEKVEKAFAIHYFFGSWVPQIDR
ncbi:hypothetical protein FACS189426_10800 [Bacteroidia bacterium]|nr:hypothetical protein FACS189426_10800 [Bacteroidia bacterium]GHT85118.1 hypothetical protein FACS18947_3480 [Bacteroidia bacterium]